MGCLVRTTKLLLTIAAVLTFFPAGAAADVKKGALIGAVSGAIAFPTYELIRVDKVCGPVRGTIHACDDVRVTRWLAYLRAQTGAVAYMTVTY